MYSHKVRLLCFGMNYSKVFCSDIKGMYGYYDTLFDNTAIYYEAVYGIFLN